MKPIKFKSTKNNDTFIIISKDIFRIMDVPDMYYGDGGNNKDGKVYEYIYDIIFNGELIHLLQDELDEAMEDMKHFVGEE